MQLPAFKRSLARTPPPPGLSPSLTALWRAGRNEWDEAHAIVMDETGADCAWVHAHLHRVEGDLGNARYWYRRAGRPVPTGTCDQEWEAIAAALLKGVGEQDERA